MGEPQRVFVFLPPHSPAKPDTPGGSGSELLVAKENLRPEQPAVPGVEVGTGVPSLAFPPPLPQQKGREASAGKQQLALQDCLSQEPEFPCLASSGWGVWESLPALSFEANLTGAGPAPPKVCFLPEGGGGSRVPWRQSPGPRSLSHWTPLP